MELLPTTLGTRPRVAVEVRAEGVIAARAADASAQLVAVYRAGLAEGAVVPGLKPGNLADRGSVVLALRKALDAVADKTRERQVTLILPDATVRVLFLDFDSLPGKASEAMPLVRFRLKKLIPFEADADAASVSYQVMSSAKGNLRVLAVAIPREVLTEYEAAVREAGFEPGAVLPSTLASLSGLDVDDSARLVINAGPKGVTTAIVRGGILLLHRTVDLTTEEPHVEPLVSLPLVDREGTMAEWAQQKPLPIGVSAQAEAEAAREAVQAEPNAVLEGVREELRELATTSGAREITQAVSVAAAYFEDTLGMPPGVLFSAGTTSADRLAAMLRDADFGGPGLRVEEIVQSDMIATSSNVTRCWLASVRGALKS